MLDDSIAIAARRRLDTLTKPHGALGRLEELAIQVCILQKTLAPRITRPTALVFAADHGIAKAGVSAYPRAVTTQMVRNYLAGGAAINVLARELAFELSVVDAGVDADLAPHPRLINAKIRRGTRDFRMQSAMNSAECEECLAAGASLVTRLAISGSNTVLLGDMGIGNTAASALLMHCLTGRPLDACIGRGTGLDDAGLARKLAALEMARARCNLPRVPHAMLVEYGGYEIAMLTGAALGAVTHRMLILVDGFAVTVAVALAARLDPAVIEHCVFSHRSAEQGHRALLNDLGAQPLLDLGLRLGEGSGAALALPLLRAAIALYADMATFEGAGVSQRSA
ncbi:MAG: nicotinate-nucleotide--dimethylbenzimidazole phosphoribosyltransferase [Steroidobacteraceae bacterium]